MISYYKIVFIVKKVRKESNNEDNVSEVGSNDIND